MVRRKAKVKRQNLTSKSEIERYQPGKIESKWRKAWEERDLYRFKEDRNKSKYYNLVELPYPSGDLHLGHWFAFVPPDVHARYKRMSGENVFFPNGFDAFGLPAENAAIKRGIHPQDWTMSNIETMKKQFATMGTMIDWSHEVITCLPEYYKWNQWIFLKMFEKGIAYRTATLSNWCPVDQTVLANEHVENGKCWRCGSEVVQKEVEQWFLRITEYADRLLWEQATSHQPLVTSSNTNNDEPITDNQTVDWPKSVQEGQNNWIGRSTGANIKFQIPVLSLSNGSNSKYQIEVFTTRPDTLFGATFLVLAPEHEAVTEILHSVQDDKVKKEVEEYVERASKKTELERKMGADPSASHSTVSSDRIGSGQGKTGVFSGGYAINPVNGEEIPIWIADYVLSGYGTGAIMAVPAHDQRDFEFAEKFGLPVKQVIARANAPVKSYLMGAEGITDAELNKLQIVIDETTPEGNRKIVIPEAQLGQYEKLIEEKLTPGFWNEYIASEIVFLFKFKDGKFKRIILSPETEEEIDKLAAEFNSEKWDKKSSVWKWLAKNNTYTDLIVHDQGGIIINSGSWDGWKAPQDIGKVMDWIEEKGFGKGFTTYHLHDWSVSRQRYWGTPIPIIYCVNCWERKTQNAKLKASYGKDYAIVDGRKHAMIPLSEKDLPVTLPYDVDYAPKGKAPLASNEEWMKVTCPECGGEAKRDPETLDTFFDSSWYFMRYIDPHYEKGPFNTELAKKLMPVDIYFGGAEHTLGHTLYARFFTKFFHDLGLVDYEEFAQKRVQHGIVLGPDGNKMSKSKGNVINPDDVASQYGADTVRLYLSFMMPYEATAPWDPGAISGVYRFLKRVWGLFDKVEGRSSVFGSELSDISQSVVSSSESEKLKTGKQTTENRQQKTDNRLNLSRKDLEMMHRTIKKVGEDIADIKFNTAVSALMEWLNYLAGSGKREAGSELSIEEYRTFILLLAPFAPHIAEELYQRLNAGISNFQFPFSNENHKSKIINHKSFNSVHLQKWPEYDEKFVKGAEVTIVIQVNGKVRDQMIIDQEKTEDRDYVEKTAKTREKIVKHLEGKSVKKVIYVPGKILNLVIQ